MFVIREAICRLTLTLFLFGWNLLGAVTIAVLAGSLVDVESGAVKKDQVILIESDHRNWLRYKYPKRRHTYRSFKGSGLARAVRRSSASVRHCRSTEGLWRLLDDGDQRSGWRTIQGVRHAREMLDSGFTTVRDLGNA